jgi:hypothetical protein
MWVTWALPTKAEIRNRNQRVDAESAAARSAPSIVARLCRNERLPPHPPSPIDRALPAGRPIVTIGLAISGALKEARSPVSQFASHK